MVQNKLALKLASTLNLTLNPTLAKNYTLNLTAKSKIFAGYRTLTETIELEVDSKAFIVEYSRSAIWRSTAFRLLARLSIISMTRPRVSILTGSTS